MQLLGYFPLRPNACTCLVNDWMSARNTRSVSSGVVCETKKPTACKRSSTSFRSSTRPISRDNCCNVARGVAAGAKMACTPSREKPGKSSLIAGTPDMVAEYIVDQTLQAGTNYFVGQLAFGNLTRDEMLASIGLFGQEVMPQVEQQLSRAGQTRAVAA